MTLQMGDPKNEYAKDKKLRESDVQAIREWLQKQPHLPEISELQLIQFLQSCYFSIEMAKATIDNFYTVRTHFSEVFTNRNAAWPPLAETMGISVYTMLEKKTLEGYTVIFCKVINGDASKYNFGEQLKCFDMALMLWLKQHGTAEGLHIVTDLKEISFAHMAKLNLMLIKKFMYYLQEALPVRLKGLHFINPVSFMDKILAMMRPFMKKELMDMLYIHADSVEGLFKYVPKECMPKDFGGSAESIAVLHGKMAKSITENTDYFKSDELQKADESKRPGKPKNEGDIFGVEGSFKKLDID